MSARTYAARTKATPSLKRKAEDDPPSKLQTRKKPATASAKAKPALTQMHLAFNNNPVKPCKTCGLTYTRGASEDEALHKTHCARVQRGLDWGRDEEKDVVRAGVQSIDAAAVLRSGLDGRIVACKADIAGGKVGAKVNILMEMISTVLSAPPLSARALANTKLYLFLVQPKGGAAREQIAGCLLAQRISTALAVIPDGSGEPQPDGKLVHGLYCAPKPLPTALGIPRVFVPLSYRRKGVAHALLKAAARTAIHGCALDPRKGEVAFSQPTDGGRQLMNAFGVTRVYEEDDQDD
ncbi:hypothetical protein AURDEDRAFT_81654 [Auricularia subglabra TFB-10046 SS5]|nr:hypothetical protein AURDEDRAFT_81654 [Auricularia subglabra TFB-10046 SS5]